MKKLLLITVLFFGFFSTSIAQKGQPTTKKSNSPQRSSPNCPLSVSIQDNTPSAVCSELLKTLVAVTDPCTDTTAVNYRWSSSVGGVFSTSRTTTFNLPEFLVATPVTFTVWIIEGADSLSANYTITVKPRPSRPNLTPFGTIILCDNNAITLTSSACTGGSTTTWSNGVSGVSSISVPAIGGTYFKVACEKNGCVSDSTAAAALITGTVTTSPTVTNRTICEGTPITAGNGLRAQLVNCGTSAAGTYTYTGPTVGYDQGYRNTGGIDPKVTVPTITGNISNIKVSITWRKQKGGFQNDCGTGDTQSWPYHNETQFRVQSPSGRIITLVNTDTYGGSNNPTVTTVFEDGATPVNFYSPPVSGTFAPAQPLSGFIGENPTGTWTLLPYDNYWKDPLCVSGFQITFTADAQVGTLTWWDAPTGGNQVGTGAEFIPTNTVAGTYTYYAQGQCARGCPSVRTPATLTINPTPQAPIISVSVPEVNGVRNVCGGESITLTATGCNNGGTVKWNSSYNGTNFATGSSYTFVPSFSSSSNISQTFTAACEGSNLCKSVNSTPLTIVVKQKPSQPSISGPGSPICLNSSVTLTASACSGGTLGWTGNRSGSSINFVLTNAVNIKVACTVNGCTSDSSNVYSITTLPKPSTPTVNASQIQALCLGDGVTLSSSCSNGTTTKWTGNLTGNPITVYPTTTRSYRASCLGTNGCPSDSSAALTIVVLPKTKPTITGSTFICGTGAGISITLTATGCSGSGETVMWRSQDTGLTYTETLSQTKTFRAVCIRGGYCVSDSSDIFTVQYRNKPSQPTIIPPQNTTICQGTSVSLTASACSGGTLGWTGGLSGQTVSVFPNTTKSYRVACMVNGCLSDSSNAVTITVNPTPVISVSANKTSLCLSDTATLTLTGCTGSISWSNGATTSIIKVSPTANTTYTATCTLGSCSANQSVTITALSTPNVTASGILQCGQTVTLTANNVPVGSSIQWRKDGVDIANATTNTLVINSAGSYNFTSYKIEEKLVNGSSNWINSVKFISPLVGFMSKQGSQTGILKTTDGGNTWVNVYSSLGGYNEITFISPLIGFAIGGNIVLKTIDGGNTWNSTQLNSNCNFYKIAFKDSNTGIIVGHGIANANFIIYYTNNQGQTWTTSSVNLPLGDINVVGTRKFSGASFVPNSSTAFAGGYDNSDIYLLKSIDNGITWNNISNSVPLSSTYIPQSIVFTSANNGIIMGLYGSNLKSTDGGTTWQSLSAGNNSSYNLKDIQFIDQNVGYIGGIQTLTKTTNGGNNWTQLSLPTNTFHIESFSFLSDNQGWLGTRYGLYKISAPQCSTPPLIIAPPQRPNAPTITPPTNSTICQGSSIILSATGCTGGTFAWTGGLTGTSVSVSPSSTRAYKVACTLNTCTSDSSSAVMITVNPKPAQPTINQTSPSICAGQSITLSVTPVNGATYAWTGSLTGTGISVSPTLTKTYKVASTINGCVSDSASVTLGVTTVLTPSITLGGEICSNTLPVKIWENLIPISSIGIVTSTVSTRDGGIFAVIEANSNVKILKLDNNGDVIWSRDINVLRTPHIKSAIQTIDGGFLLGGYTNSTTISPDADFLTKIASNGDHTTDFWLLKIDTDGNTQWSKNYGGDREDLLQKIEKTSDGGYLLGGTTNSGISFDVSESGSISDYADYWIVKVDVNGTKLWDKRWFYNTGGENNYFIEFGSIKEEGTDIVVSGIVWQPYGDETYDFHVLKFNNAGVKLWEKLFAKHTIFAGTPDMIIMPDKSIIFAAAAVPVNNQNLNDLYLFKIDKDGTKLWDKKINVGSAYSQKLIRKMPSENNIIVVALSNVGISSDKTEPSRGGNDLWINKFNENGIKIWDKTIGGSSEEYVGDMTINANDEIVLGGFSSSPLSGDKNMNNEGAWFVKIASNCPPQSSKNILMGDSLILKANPCAGTINWSNGMTGNSIVIKPVFNTTYTATCSTTCTSPVSSPFIVSVTGGICESVKSGSWNDPTVWACGIVPTANENVIINTGHTITNNGGIIRAKSLNYRGGNLQISSTSNLILGN